VGLRDDGHTRATVGRRWCGRAQRCAVAAGGKPTATLEGTGGPLLAEEGAAASGGRRWALEATAGHPEATQASRGDTGDTGDTEFELTLTYTLLQCVEKCNRKPL